MCECVCAREKTEIEIQGVDSVVLGSHRMDGKLSSFTNAQPLPANFLFLSQRQAGGRDETEYELVEELRGRHECREREHERHQEPRRF